MPTRSGHLLANDPAERIRDATAALAPRRISLRRDIHAHPELGFEEARAAGIVAAELARLGIPHRTGLGRTGVVGTIEGGRPGPTFAIRADMDALPIQEETGLPFASTAPGEMHACVHDIHTATPLGAAAALKELAPRLAGRVQPAVVTIGQVQVGATHNVIPERVHLKGTVRTPRQASRDTAEAALRRLVAGLEAGMRVSCALDRRRLVPALVNDDRALDPPVASVRRRFGDEAVSEGEPAMGAEGFAEVAAQVPSARLRVGSGAPGRGDRLHNADFQPDERCVGLGAQALSRAALDMLA